MMDANKILKTDVLDIIFDGRNKAYGAYELRTAYNRRLRTALLSMALFCLLLVGGFFLSNVIAAGKIKRDIMVNDIQLEDLKPEEPKVEPPLPPPPKAVEPPKNEITQYTDPKIVKDEEVKEDEKPPEMEKLEETKIGTFNQEGIKDDGLVAPPPADDGKGVVEAPKKIEEDYDKTFTKVEIESEYPGGPPAWMRYLNRNFQYPPEAQDNEIQGEVEVRFIVDKEGNVSEVEAVSGPKELRPEATRVIKKSGKWTPAEQNGRKVKSYKRQKIVFRLSN